MLHTDFRNVTMAACLIRLSCAAARAQSAALPSIPAFEVASIRPAVVRERAAGARVGGQMDASCGPERFTMDGSIVRYTCVPLSILIADAFRVRVNAPDWVSGNNSPKFEIIAKIPEGGWKRAGSGNASGAVAGSF